MRMIDSESHPIIVLGVERSGTSVVAEMLHKWGAYAGPSDKLHEADVHAPRGYWEYEPLWDLLAALGDFDAGETWWDCDFQRRMSEKAADPVYKQKATDLMAEMHKGSPWFWKDPALSHFLPFWKQIWGDAVYIITVRNPLDTAVSWQKFIMPPDMETHVSFIAMNLLRWQHMMTLILQHTEDAQDRLFLGYEDIIREPRAQVEKLAGFLDARFGKRGSSIQKMVDVVEPRLWRNDCGIPFEQVPESTLEQKALYAFAREKIDDPFKQFDIAKYPLPPGYLEFLNVQEALLKACRELEVLTDP